MVPILNICIFLYFMEALVVTNSQSIPTPVGINQVFLSINQTLNGRNQNQTNPLKILTRNELKQLINYINSNKNDTKILYDRQNEGDFINYLRLVNEVQEEPQKGLSDLFRSNQQLDYLKILDIFLIIKENRFF